MDGMCVELLSVMGKVREQLSEFMFARCLTAMLQTESS